MVWLSDLWQLRHTSCSFPFLLVSASCAGDCRPEMGMRRWRWNCSTTSPETLTSSPNSKRSFYAHYRYRASAERGLTPKPTAREHAGLSSCSCEATVLSPWSQTRKRDALPLPARACLKGLSLQFLWPRSGVGPRRVTGRINLHTKLRG